MLKQYKKLLDFDNITLDFNDNAIAAVADIVMENKTGARGLRSVIEKILMDIMYEANDMGGKKITITEKMVRSAYQKVS